MTKKETEGELRRLLSILTEGSHEEVRSAKKAIEKLWRKDSKIFTRSASVVFEYLSKFNQIEKVKNQAGFVQGLSLFFLALGDEYFDQLKNFTLQVIQHPNGTVREAIRKTADWLFVSLTARICPFVYPKGKELTAEQKTMQTQAQEQYINLVNQVGLLIDKYDGETGVRFIEEMKPSINKSLQLFWSRLTERRAYQKIIDQARPIPYEIMQKRKEIENELLEMLKEAGSNFDLEDIKDIIYNEDGQSSLTDIIAMFDAGEGVTELENALEIINEAWNYFPHKILGGLSPTEKLMEYQKSQQSDLNHSS